MLRKTSQNLIPLTKEIHDDSSYDIYPSFPIEKGAIKEGYAALAEELSNIDTVILDGYLGVDWNVVRSSLNVEYQKRGLTTSFLNINDFLMPEEEISLWWPLF